MSPPAPQPEPSGLARLSAFALRAVRMELRIYTSLGRWIGRRPDLPAGARGFGYHRPVQTILVIFIVLSAIEIPIFDLIVHRWPVVRITLLVLGIWGLTWMLGLLAAYLMRPIAVGPAGIRVRHGIEVDVPLAWSDIADVRRERRIDEPKTPCIVVADDGTRTLAYRMQDETNLRIELAGPLDVRLPGRPPKGGAQTIDSVRLWVDDPDGFLAAVAALRSAESPR
ncbi:hypothetical protein [Agromyces seonyuensis]|uniref:PH domain-containing protein n=1 Tax=Agromyces seonyuensis TaxID=2662446 RepID=A0A6I4NR72_9MICO|nr:hypothetical protein [Agromyces seonyuensis]MWB96948.1 hypothetical protein [Agromyces seonyuensis]